jgi:uncharacterized protein YycO
MSTITDPIQVLFCNSKTPGSFLIRTMTWSDWSHVALVRGNWAIEAVHPKVRMIDLKSIRDHYPSTILVTFPCSDPDLTWHFACSQISKPYDTLALCDFLTHRSWESPDKWFCSELVTAAIHASGTLLFRPDSLSRITPQHLWLLPFMEASK